MDWSFIGRPSSLFGCLNFTGGDVIPYKSVYTEGVKSRFRALSPKMIEFVDLYMLHGSATKAVQEGTYKTNNPHRQGVRLLSHPLIREEITKRTAARSKKFEVTADYLVDKLQAIVQRTEEDNPQAALRAIELLGKTIAIWKDRQEITGADGEAIKLEQKIKENAADFTRRISGLAQRAGSANVVEFPDKRGTGDS